MTQLIAAGILALQLSGDIPKPQFVTIRKPNVFSRLAHAIRHAGSVEPALALRFSGWGIPDPDKPESRVTASTRRKQM